MGAISKGDVTETKTYERADSGVYAARCIQVVELGTHDNEYKGEVKQRKELMIVWELAELMQDGRPFTVNWRGTNSLNEKSGLYKMLVGWRGKAFTPQELAKFELKNILDKLCMVNVTKETSKAGKEYNKMVSVMPLPKGMTVPERANELVDFGINDMDDKELFALLWPWVQNIVKDSKEGKAYFEGIHDVDPEEEGEAF